MLKSMSASLLSISSHKRPWSVNALFIGLLSLGLMPGLGGGAFGQSNSVKTAPLQTSSSATRPQSPFEDPRPAPRAADKASQAPKATRQEREAAERLSPLARASFWLKEVDKDPFDLEAQLALSRTLRTLGRYDEALQAASKVLVLHPDHYEAQMEAARAYLGQGQGFYAISHLEAAAKLKPKDPQPLNLLGVAYDQTQRSQDAYEVWNRALSLSPNHPGVLTNIGLALAAQGKVVEAEKTLRLALSQPGADARTRQNLALLIGLQGRTQEAETLLRKDLPPEQVDENLAWLHARLNPPASQPAAPPQAGPTDMVLPPPRPAAQGSTAAPAPKAKRSWDSLKSAG